MSLGTEVEALTDYMCDRDPGKRLRVRKLRTILQSTRNCEQ
jgi:hypothetical protein